MRIAVLFAASLLYLLDGQAFAVKTADGGWYTVNSTGTAIEKRSSDLTALIWTREAEAGETRGLRLAPGGGVVRLSQGPFRSTTIAAWDADGSRKFHLHFLMLTPRLAVDSAGDILIAGDSLRMLRLNSRGELLAELSAPVDGVNALGGIELSGDGVLFAAGGTSSAGLQTTPNAAQREHRGGTCLMLFRNPIPYTCNSGWVGRFDARTLAVEALTYLSGPDENFLNALALDADGNPVVAGTAVQRTMDREPYPRTGGAVAPKPRERPGQAMTVSRLSPFLDRVMESAWLTGSDEASAMALNFDAAGRVLIQGTTTSPNFPGTEGWTRACGPRRGLNATAWNFGLRLSPALERVEGSVQFGEAMAPALIDFDSRADCVFNGGSYEFGRSVAAGQVMTMIGGPFRADEDLSVNGVAAPVLYRSETQINFTIPREAGTGDNLPLALKGRVVRRVDVKAARPVWIWNILDDGTLSNRGNFQINARRPDGTLNSDANGFQREEEVRAYATGIDLGRPLQLFLNYYDKELPVISASYVPGTFDSVVEFRIRDDRMNGGMNVIGIVNDGVYSGSNPGFIWGATSGN